MGPLLHHTKKISENGKRRMRRPSCRMQHIFNVANIPEDEQLTMMETLQEAQISRVMSLAFSLKPITLLIVD